MVGVRGGFIASLVPPPNAVLTHQPLDARLAGRVSPSTQLPHQPRRTVGAFERLVDGPNQGEHLRIGEPLALGAATALPGAVTTDADRQSFTNRRQRIGFPVRIDPGVLQSTSFAKYAVAFFRISFSIRRRAFSARTRDSSICSAVTALPPGALSLPRPAALTQLHSDWSTNPNYRATAPITCPSVTRLTANFLNTAVYACFGILNIFSPPSQLSLTSTHGRRNFGGSSALVS